MSIENTINEHDEEIVYIRTTVPFEDLPDDTWGTGQCYADRYVGVKKSRVKQLLKERPELIARNKDKDLMPYL